MTARSGPAGGAGVDRLKHLLEAASILLMPTAHDPLSAWLSEMAGFEAVLVSRAALAMATLVSDDPGDVDDEVVVDRTAQICRLVSVPVMVDLTPSAPSPRRLRNTVTALAMSGAAGVIIDDSATDDGQEALLSGPAFHARLLAARQGLELRGLEVVTVARTLALARGATSVLGAVARLSALGPAQHLGIVDGLDFRDLHRWAASSEVLPLMFLDDHAQGDEAVAAEAESAGFRAYAWTRPLIEAAIGGMRHTLAVLAGDEGQVSLPPAPVPAKHVRTPSSRVEPPS